MRMNTSVPKQFMQLGSKTVIEWSIGVMASHPMIDGVFVGLSPNNDRRDWVSGLHPNVRGVFNGGMTRAETVRNGLEALLDSGCSGSDWVLVHDANRPFLISDEVELLINQVGSDLNGGLLCLPVYDTVKISDSGRVEKTLDRNIFYRAQTPQLFPIELLLNGLNHCIESKFNISDESQAMEVQGYSPILVKGSDRNLKITTTDDLIAANSLLTLIQKQESELS